jgi:hypothetical protein
MTNVARRDHLRRAASTISEDAEARCTQLSEAPDLQAQLRGVMRISEQVQLLLGDIVIPDDMLDLGETVLRGLEAQLHVFDEQIKHTAENALLVRRPMITEGR